jgi:hypothetical protein
MHFIALRRFGRVEQILAIPAKFAVSQVIGFIKGKSAIHLARDTESAGVTLWVRVSGPAGILSRRSDEMRR